MSTPASANPSTISTPASATASSVSTPASAPASTPASTPASSISIPTSESKKEAKPKTKKSEAKSEGKSKVKPPKKTKSVKDQGGKPRIGHMLALMEILENVFFQIYESNDYDAESERLVLAKDLLVSNTFNFLKLSRNWSISADKANNNLENLEEYLLYFTDLSDPFLPTAIKTGKIVIFFCPFNVLSKFCLPSSLLISFLIKFLYAS